MWSQDPPPIIKYKMLTETVFSSAGRMHSSTVRYLILEPNDESIVTTFTTHHLLGKLQ